MLPPALAPPSPRSPPFNAGDVQCGSKDRATDHANHNFPPSSIEGGAAEAEGGSRTYFWLISSGLDRGHCYLSALARGWLSPRSFWLAVSRVVR